MNKEKILEAKQVLYDNYGHGEAEYEPDVLRALSLIEEGLKENSVSSTQEKCYTAGGMGKLATEIVKVNKKNGWNVTKPEDWENKEVYRLGCILALIHSEVSEALEAVRHNDRENFEEELADIIIRVLDLSGGLSIDIDKAVRDKIERNKKRGYRHGGKAV